MTDEEAMKRMQDLVNKLTEDKAFATGACSLEAIKNRIRRKIIDALEERPLTIQEVSENVGVAGAALRFHLNFLRSSYFIEIEGDMVDLTAAGVFVVRRKRRT